MSLQLTQVSIPQSACSTKTCVVFQPSRFLTNDFDIIACSRHLGEVSLHVTVGSVLLAIACTLCVGRSAVASIARRSGTPSGSRDGQ